MSFRRAPFLACALWAAVAPGGRVRADSPPSWTADAEAVVTGGRPAGSGGPGGPESSALTASWVHRWELGSSAWYAGAGAVTEQYAFGADSEGTPDRLQDYAGEFALDYFQDGESVASIDTRPGLYFEHRASSSAWDIPTEAYTGIPIGHGWDGVVGVDNGRFWHHALPIAGVVWEASSRVRVEAVFPDPAVVVALTPAYSLRLGGELAGGGFRSDSAEGGGPVEYDSYRVGADLTVKGRRASTTLGLGVETERSFDFLGRGVVRDGGGAGYLKVGVEFGS